MKILCDVHLPKKLVQSICEQGIKAIHGSEILNGWRTKDNDFCAYADNNNFVVVTKDKDFRNSHFLQNSPLKLIKINLGNISNDELISIFKTHISSFKEIFDEHKCVYIEVNKKPKTILIQIRE